MAKGRIEQEIALTITGLDDVKDVDKRIDTLTKQKKKISLDVDDKGAAKRIADIDDTLEALAKRKHDLTVTANVDKALRSTKDVVDNLDKLDGQTATAVLGIKAAEIEQVLSDVRQDLAQIDGEEVDVEVRATQAKALTDELERVKGTIKEINATPVEVDAKPAQDGFDKVGKSADQAKSVSANAIGNMTQDLGALGGVAGSTGVAIGQFGEYFADAASAGNESIGSIAKNFITFAGPLTAATLAVGILTQTFADFQKAAGETKAFNRDRVDAFVDALSDAKLTLQEMQEVLASGGEGHGIFVRIADETVNADLAVAKLFGTFQNFNDEVKKGLPGYDAWAQSMITNAEAAGATDDQLTHLRVVLDDARDGAVNATAATVAHSSGLDTVQQAAVAYSRAILDSGDATKRAGFEQRFYGAALDDTQGSAENAAKAVDANARAYVDQATGIRNSMAATEEANAAAKEFADTLASTDYQQTKIEGATAGMSAFHDQFFALTHVASDFEGALDDLGKSLEDNGKTFDVNTAAGRDNLNAIENLASAVDTQLAGALAGGSSSLGEFSTKAAGVANTLRDRLINELHLSGEEADDVIRKLGLMPDDVKTRYELSGTEMAMQQLGLLQGTIERLPKNVQAVIDYKIAMGDYAGAVQTAQNYANRHPVTIPVELRVSTANLTAAQMAAINAGRGEMGMNSAPWPGALAGEAGPEFIRRPGRPQQLLTGPAMVPPGTRIISVKRTRAMLARAGREPRAMATGGVAPFVASVPLVVNVNAAVIGSRYEVAKAVGQGTRDLRRLIGNRGTAA